MCVCVCVCVCVCQSTWLGKHGICSMERRWKERGTEDREVNDGNYVKEIFRLGESPMWYIALQASKGVFPWKGQVGWNRVVGMS